MFIVMDQTTRHDDEFGHGPFDDREEAEKFLYDNFDDCYSIVEVIPPGTSTAAWGPS